MGTKSSSAAAAAASAKGRSTPATPPPSPNAIYSDEMKWIASVAVPPLGMRTDDLYLIVCSWRSIHGVSRTGESAAASW